MAMRTVSAGVVIALVCLLAAHGVAQASRMGPVRKLSQVPGGMGGVYAFNGDGIVVVNTVVYGSGGVVISDSGYYADGYVVYLEGGIVFGYIYGGIIYPPNQATYYPPAIVAVVVFGPVFAQSWFIGPAGVVVWSTTIFYRAGGLRIYNPAGYNGPFYNSAGALLGSYSNSVPRIESNTVIQQNNVNINVNPPPRQVETPAAAGKAPISSAIGKQGVTVSPGAAPGGSPIPDRSGSPRSPDSRSPDSSRSPDARSPGFSASPDISRRSGSPSGGSPPEARTNGSPGPSGPPGSPRSGNNNDRRDANGSPLPDSGDNSGGGGGGVFNGGGGDSSGNNSGGDRGGGGIRDRAGK